MAHPVHPRIDPDPYPLWYVLIATPEEKLFWDLINEARQHPELDKYRPLGNTQGALMAGCRYKFFSSHGLTDTASSHNDYLKDQDKAWVVADLNMHRGPSGKLVWEDGEPMYQRSFIVWRAENVAVGYETPEEAVRAWMQHDEEWGWGHRNAILRCETKRAGVSHYQGGPWGHYWTLDMGTRPIDMG
ncbi:CAP domain-containing protein [Streptomyces sp. NPDC006655]|uniref:CAP domain-containing protein n=1 Tax=Streptomyces sp. NPDC006655 TaxID=3156898 RepID=UPI003454CC18